MYSFPFARALCLFSSSSSSSSPSTNLLSFPPVLHDVLFAGFLHHKMFALTYLLSIKCSSLNYLSNILFMFGRRCFCCRHCHMMLLCFFAVAAAATCTCWLLSNENIRCFFFPKQKKKEERSLWCLTLTWINLERLLLLFGRGKKWFLSLFVKLEYMFLGGIHWTWLNVRFICTAAKMCVATVAAAPSSYHHNMILFYVYVAVRA